MKKIYKIIIIVLVIFVIVGFDTRLKIVKYHIKGNDNLKIVLLSDLHGCYYGKKMHTITDVIEKEKPDMVFLIGDMFDKDISFKNTEILLENIEFPMYLIMGDAEYQAGKLDKIEKILIKNKVTILDDSTVVFNDMKVNISGISDSVNGLNIEEKLDLLAVNSDSYNILLAHRPENIDIYRKYDFDLICSGHANGGRWRIPFLINGLYTEEEGMFPKYAGGLYQFNDLNFIVSRGLSIENNRIPRFYNRPELIIINIERN